MQKALLFIGAIIIVLGLVYVTLTRVLNNNTSQNDVRESQNQLESTESAMDATSQAQKKYSSPPPTLSQEELALKKATIKTAKGDIVIEFFPIDSPKTVSNFIFLAREGFYDGLTFHRRDEGFVIQGGDPNGNGTGGPGYKFTDEPVKRKYDRGIVAMANSGPNTNGSQFFIMLKDNETLLPNYTIFGGVVTGIDVVDKIQIGDKIESVVVE